MPFKVNIRTVNENPVHEAEVRAFTWSGNSESEIDSTRTDQEGKASLNVPEEHEGANVFFEVKRRGMAQVQLHRMNEGDSGTFHMASRGEVSAPVLPWAIALGVYAVVTLVIGLVGGAWASDFGMVNAIAIIPILTVALFIRKPIGVWAAAFWLLAMQVYNLATTFSGSTPKATGGAAGKRDTALDMDISMNTIRWGVGLIALQLGMLALIRHLRQKKK